MIQDFNEAGDDGMAVASAGPYCGELQICIWPSWCHCHSLSLASVKFRLVLPFWYHLTQVVVDKWPLNRCC